MIGELVGLERNEGIETKKEKRECFEPWEGIVEGKKKRVHRKGRSLILIGD